MNALAERRLSELLLELTNEPTEQAADLRLPEVLDLRLGMEHADVSEEARRRHLQAISQRLIDFDTNSEGPSGLRSRRQWLWSSVALVAAILAFVLLNVSVLSRKDIEVQREPAFHGPAPQVQLHTQPKEPIVKNQPSLGTRPSEEVPPKLKRGLDEGVIGRRLEIGKVLSVMGGPVVWQPGERKPLVAQRGTSISFGSRIETGDIDKAEVQFDDGTQISLDFNTTLVIDTSLAGRRPRELRLLAGRLMASVVHSTKESPLRVWTSLATAEVLGTRFSLELGPLNAKSEVQRATLQVQEGAVAFFNNRGRVTAKALTESSATGGAAPTKPKPLEVLRIFYRGYTSSVWLVLDEPASPDSLARQYVYPTAYSGLRIGDLSSLERSDLPIVEIDPESPAKAAGLCVGDIVLAVDGKSARTAEDVHRQLRVDPGRTFRIRVRRGARLVDFRLRTDPWGEPISVRSSMKERLLAATRHAILGDLHAAIPALESIVAIRPEAPALNNLGAAHMADRAPGKANGYFKKAVQVDPSQPLYRLNWGLALRSVGNLSRSQEELQALHRLDPDFRPTEVAEGLFLMERPKDALVVLDGAIGRTRRHPGRWKAQGIDLLLARAEMLLFMRKYDLAEQAAAEAIQLDPDSAASWSVTGRIQEEAGIGGAESNLKKALRIDCTSSGNYVHLARYFQRRSKPKDALSLYRIALLIDPTNRIAALNSAACLESLGHWKDAENRYRRLLADTPNDFVTHHALAGLLAKLNESEEAIREYATAIAIEPRYLSARYGLYLHLRKLGRSDEAEALYQEGLSKFVGEDLAHHLDSRAYFLATNGLELVEAIALANRACEILPDGNNLLTLGIAYMRHGDMEQAETALLRSVTAYGGRAGANMPLNRLGELYFSKELHRRAIETRFKQLEHDPGCPEAWKRIGDSFERLGDRSQAVAAWNKALEMYLATWDSVSKTAWRLAWLAEVYRSLGRHKEAIDVLKRSVDLDPKARWVWEALAGAYHAQGQTSLAREATLKAWTLDPKGSWNLDNYCRLTYQQALPKEAENAWQAAIRTYPDDTDLLNRVGWLLIEENVNLREALEISLDGENKGSIDCSANAGFAYYKLGELERAKTQFERVLVGTEFGKRNDVRQQASWSLLGTIYGKLGQPQKAKEITKGAWEMKPGSFEALYYYCSACYAAGDSEEAEAVWRNAMEANPDSRMMNVWIGALLINHKKHPEIALKLLMRAYETDPTNTNGIVNVGWAYYRLGDLPKAEEWFSRALVGTPWGKRKNLEQPSSWAALGEICEKLGKPEKAKEAYSAALALDPREPAAIEGMKRLGGS